MLKHVLIVLRLKRNLIPFPFLILTNIESSTEERSIRRAALESSIRDVLFQIIKFVNEKKDHVPPIAEGVVYFPYEITMPRSVRVLLIPHSRMPILVLHWIVCHVILTDQEYHIYLLFFLQCLKLIACLMFLLSHWSPSWLGYSLYCLYLNKYHLAALAFWCNWSAKIC